MLKRLETLVRITARQAPKSSIQTKNLIYLASRSKRRTCQGEYRAGKGFVKSLNDKFTLLYRIKVP